MPQKSIVYMIYIRCIEKTHGFHIESKNLQRILGPIGRDEVNSPHVGKMCPQQDQKWNRCDDRTHRKFVLKTKQRIIVRRIDYTYTYIRIL